MIEISTPDAPKPAGHYSQAIVHNGMVYVSGQLPIDPQTGVVIDRRHDLSGESIKGKAFVFPYGRGSTGTPGIFLEAVRNNVAPAAVINLKSEPMIIVCALLAEEFYGAKIPVVDDLDEDPIKTIRTGDRVRVDGQSGMVEVIREV